MLAQTAFTAPDIDWWGVAPQLVLLTGALTILLVNALLPTKPPSWMTTGMSIVTSVVTIVFAFILWYDVRDPNEGPASIIAGALGVDGFSVFFMVLLPLVAIVGSLLIHDFATREGIQAPELHALLLSAALGGIVMAQANDLIVLFLGLETLSLALYVAAAMYLRKSEAQEAAVKYFVLGAFSSAFFLYGIALIYGATGSTNLVEIRDFLDATVLTENGLLLIGIGLLVVGLGFKVAAVPFHMWAPDVYQGAATPVSGVMAAMAKAAGFAAIIRVLNESLGLFSDDWTPLIWALAALSLVVGSVLAVVQTDVKRMLAYSSIAHAGYVLVAVESASDDGVTAALFYVFTYSFLVLGSFGAVAALSGRGDRATTLDDLSGLSRRRPLLAMAFTVFLLAQAGVPFTSGFIGKFLAIRAAAESGSWILAIIAMVAAVIATYFYLRIVVAMWLTEPDEGAAPVEVPFANALALAGCVGVTIVVGIVPQFLIEFAGDAVPVLVSAQPF
ncbi:MAG: NADH-quinone oxidoreductase subunit N [Actinomycetota bacterium]